MNNLDDNARRDAFLWKVVEQFEGLTRWVAGPLKAQAWEDGREAVFSVRQDDFELLRFSASFDDEGARQKCLAQKLNLIGEWKGETSELLVLGWKNSAPDLDKGLDSAADHTEGEFAGAMGKVVELLRDKLGEALKPQPVSVSRALARTTQREQVPVIDTLFEPVRSVARADRVPERKEERDAMPAIASAQEPDMELLRHALESLPDMEASHAREIFAGFIKAAGSRSPLRQGDVAAFVQGGLEELHAFQEAYLEGRSPLTQAGVGLKGWMLIGALIVAMGAETMTGVFAFGPIIGHSIEALPLAGVGSFLIGGGLLPMAETDKERRRIVGVAVAWALAVSGLSAKNERLAEPAQGLFALEEKASKAQARALSGQLGLLSIERDLRYARDEQTKSRDAYLNARKNRPAVLDKAAGDVKALARDEKAARENWVDAENAKHQAMKSDPSRLYAEGVVFVICSILNAAGPVFIGQYLSRVERDHSSALGRARRRRHVERKARALRRSESAQKQKARVMLTAMRSYYTDALLKTGRFTETEAEKMVNSAFGNAGAIVKEAVKGFRSSIRPNLARFGSLFSGKNALD
jgi:hypothetical protein